MTIVNETPAHTTDLTGLITGLYQETLHEEDLGPDSDFYEAGGDSLTAFQIIARLDDALGIEIPVALVFAFPTPTDLAGAVASLGGGHPASDN